MIDIDSVFILFQYPFMQRALIAGCVIGLTAAFLSVFVTLRNMSFYADAISHSALAGIAIGIMLGIAPFPAAVFFCIILSILTVFIKKKTTVSIDTLMGVLFASGISLGIVLISQLQNIRTDLFTYLFGDILAVSWNDIILSAILALVIITYLLYYSKQLLLNTFSPDFAYIRNVKNTFIEYSFFIATALTIALSIKIVGIVLITGLLILPGAVAKNLAKSFKQTVLISLIVGILSAVTGIIASYYLDLPSGPAIILVSTVLFIVTIFFKKR